MIAKRALLYAAGGGIGDSLLATVVARALRDKYEAVDALTLSSHRETLMRVPDLNEVLVDEGEERDVAAVLRARAYDAAVVTWATARTARIPQLARIPLRVGQSRRLYSHRFNRRVAVRSELGDVTSHWTDILLDYARAIGCDTSDTAPVFVPTSDDESAAATLIQRLTDGNAFAILHPANAEATRREVQWPTRAWSSLALALSERAGVRVLISGSDADREIASRIAQDGDAIAIAGETPIGVFGALARRARVFAGITTGTMHVAAAVGAPTVGVFPFQTDTPERWAPHGPRTAVVRATYPCRTGERKETCPDYACIANLDIPRIIASVQQMTAVLS
ncbi:MAG: glycosyltransferase family 9 protein [Candidatus Eremiobacteraeota bacterium]|nr:glycosyltransferase family 9 protein [Candidatus Eremiobacteraeota bacterium]